MLLSEIIIDLDSDAIHCQPTFDLLGLGNALLTEYGRHLRRNRFKKYTEVCFTVPRWRWHNSFPEPENSAEVLLAKMKKLRVLRIYSSHRGNRHVPRAMLLPGAPHLYIEQSKHFATLPNTRQHITNTVAKSAISYFDYISNNSPTNPAQLNCLIKS